MGVYMVGGRGHSDFLSFLWGKIMKIRDMMGYRGLLFSAASSQGHSFRHEQDPPLHPSNTS